jgi:calcineurin-like phosphoesterase family protein
MDEKLIVEWNSVVGKHDTVYHLGDFGYGSRMVTEGILSRLNGIKVLIRGNHDSKRVTKAVGWRDTYSLKKIKVYGSSGVKTNVVLCHYPLYIWEGKHTGTLHLHGHLHATKGDGHHGEFNEPGALDVGVDGHGFRPWSVDEVLQRIKDDVKKFNNF